MYAGKGSVITSKLNIPKPSKCNELQDNVRYPKITLAGQSNLSTQMKTATQSLLTGDRLWNAGMMVQTAMRLQPTAITHINMNRSKKLQQTKHYTLVSFI